MQRLQFIVFLSLIAVLQALTSVNAFEEYDECMSGSASYWIDPILGSDHNDGSIKAPFATISRLQMVPCQDVLNFTYSVQLSPVEHLVASFTMASNSIWDFSTCTVCPDHETRDQMASLVLVPSAHINQPGIFSSLQQSEDLETEALEDEWTARNSRVRNSPPPSISQLVPTLSFTNIIIRPRRECFTEEERVRYPSICVFNVSLFYVSESGLALSSVVIENFNLSFDSPTQARFISMISSSKRNLVYQNCTFRNNHMISNTKNDVRNFVIKSVPLFGVNTGVSALIINHSSFLFNSVTAPFIYGGLLSSFGSATISDSTFLSNQGYVGIYGIGLVFFAGEGCALSVSNSLFEDGNFNVLPRKWDDSAESEALGMSSAAAIGIHQECSTSVTISATAFHRNNATQGGAVAMVGMIDAGCIRNMPGSIDIILDRVNFTLNGATSGLASAVFLQGIHTRRNSFVSLSHVVFDSNTKPDSRARLRVPGKKIQDCDLTDYTVLAIVDFRNSFLKMEQIQFLATFPDLNDYYVHRSTIVSTGSVEIVGLEYTHQHLVTGARVTQLQVQGAISSVTVRNVVIKLASDYQPTKYDLQALTLFLFEEFEEKVQISFKNWTMHVASQQRHLLHQDVTLLAVRGATSISIEYFDISGITDSRMPLLMIDGTRVVKLDNFKVGSSGQILITNALITTLSRMTIFNHTSEVPLLLLETIRSIVRIKESVFFTSTSPFLRLVDSHLAVITDSSFEKASIGTMEGAVSLNMVLGVVFERCSFKDLSSLQGPSITADRVRSITIGKTFFENTAAFASDGGAIWIESVWVLVVTQSSFINTHALGRGGAIYSTSSIFRLSASTFANNSANMDGGAVCFESRPFNFNSGINLFSQNPSISTLTLSASQGSDPAGFELTSSTFRECSSEGSGGAVAILSASLSSYIRMNGSTFEKCSSESSGGAIAISTDSSYLTVLDCLFDHNQAKASQQLSKGGALFVQLRGQIDFAGQFGVVQEPPTIRGCRFDNNTASLGGALHLISYPVDLLGTLPNETNVFKENKAHFAGGAIYFSRSYTMPAISGQLFERNQAEYSGGDVAFDDAPIRETRWLQNFLINNSFVPAARRPIWGPYCAADILVISSTRPNTNPRAPPTDFALNFPSNEAQYRPNIVTPSTQIFRAPHHDLDYGEIFPGISKTVHFYLSDLFGQTVPLEFHGANWLSLSLTSCTYKKRPISIDFSYTMAQYSNRSEIALNFLVTISKGAVDPKNPQATIMEPVNCLLKWEVNPSFENLFFGTLENQFIIRPCGFRTGQMFNSTSCYVCTLGTYSFTGKCQSCIHDPHVICYAGSVLPRRNYWVSIDSTSNKFRSVRCPASFCLGVQSSALSDSFLSLDNGEQEATNSSIRRGFCSAGREGTMCGKCVPGLHESLLSVCIRCSKPNWIMLSLAILTLWLAVFILHSLVAVSSGKSTILIFFIQSCFILNYQISPYEVFRKSTGENPSQNVSPFLAFVLCIIPLDALNRNLVIGLVPFIMAIMLFTTFGARCLLVFLWSKFASFRRTEMREDGFQVISESLASDYDDICDPYSETDQTEDDLNLENTSINSSRRKMVELDDDVILDSNENDEGDNLINSAEQLQSEHDRQQTEIRHHWLLQMQFWHPYRMLRTTASLFASSFSSILGIAISTMDCVSLMDGTEVLQSAPAVSCKSSQFKLFRNLNGLWVPYLIFVFGALLWTFVSGYRKKTLSSTDVRFGVWYEMYKPQFFAWKLTEMIRRLVLSLVAKALLPTPDFRSVALFVISVAFIFIHLIAKPYKKRLENRLETLSLSSLGLISLINIWNTRQFGMVNPSKGPLVFVWVYCFIVSAFIVAVIVFDKVRTNNAQTQLVRPGTRQNSELRKF